MVIILHRRLSRGIEVHAYGGEYARTGYHLETYVPAERAADDDLEWDIGGMIHAVDVLTAALPSDRGF